MIPGLPRSVVGTLDVAPALHRRDLLAAPVAAAISDLDAADTARCGVAAIDPELADTAAFCAAYHSPLDASANCVVVTGRRADEQRYGACLVLATTWADVNGVVRRRLDVRKASFAPTAEVVALTGMAHGGITPFGLPAGWPLLLDAAVASAPAVVVGSGLRSSKLVVPGELLARLRSSEVVDGLGMPAPAGALSPID